MIKKLLALCLSLFAAIAFAAVDVNKATPAELDGIKGIGPAIAGKITAERAKGNFKDWPDFIERVKGVGEGNAAKFSEAGLTVNGAAFAGAPAKPAAAPAAKKEAAKADAKPAAATAAAAPAAPAASAAMSKEDKKAAAAKEKADKAAAKKAKAEEEKKAKADKAAAKKAEKEAKAGAAAPAAPASAAKSK